MLSNERTLAAWWRTSLAALAAAVAFARLFGGEPGWLIKGGATALVLLALLMLWMAFRRYRRTARRLHAHESVDEVTSWTLAAGTSLLLVAAGVAAFSIWLF